MAIVQFGGKGRFSWHDARLMLTAAFIFVAIAGCSSQEEVEKIPLASMYATHPHDGMKRLSLSSADADTVEHFMGLSPWAWNLFLIRAEHLPGATVAALRFQDMTQTGVPRDEEGKPWLVVYFGFASSDSMDWTIQSVERSTSKIVVTYAGPRTNIVRTAGASPAFVLVPLTSIAAANYELELRHSGTKRIMLMRRSRVGDITK